MHKYISLCISVLEFYCPFLAVIANLLGLSLLSNDKQHKGFSPALPMILAWYFICWLSMPVFLWTTLAFFPHSLCGNEGRERDHLLQELRCGTCEPVSLVVSFLRNFLFIYSSKYCLSADYKWINYIVWHRCFCFCLGRAVGFYYCSIWMLVFFLDAFLIAYWMEH